MTDDCPKVIADPGVELALAAGLFHEIGVEAHAAGFEEQRLQSAKDLAVEMQELMHQIVQEVAYPGLAALVSGLTAGGAKGAGEHAAAIEAGASVSAPFVVSVAHGAGRGAV